MLCTVYFARCVPRYILGKLAVYSKLALRNTRQQWNMQNVMSQLLQNVFGNVTIMRISTLFWSVPFWPVTTTWINVCHCHYRQLINPWHAYAARVTIVGFFCLSVCLLSHISPLERLFVLKTLSRTQQATKVKTIVGFSLILLRCRDLALSALYGYLSSAIFRYAQKHA